MLLSSVAAHVVCLHVFKWVLKGMELIEGVLEIHTTIDHS